jgi:regulator of protease activity HflC (stomatin/prohibitin superfamily)
MQLNMLKGKIGIMIWTLLIVILLFMFVGCERIDAGHVGIKVNNTGGSQGVSKTEYVTGWNFYWRLAQRIYEFPTYQQHKEYEEYSVPTKGGAVFEVHPSFNYSLNAGEVANMFQKFRLGIAQLEEGYLKNAVAQSVREVTNTFTVDSILNNLAIYDASILEKLNQTLKPYFVVTQFTANLQPDKRLSESILNKAKAIQEAQASLAQVQVAEANAKVDITNARKDSAVRVTLAKGEAEAIKVKQDALKQSPQYVELIKAEAWDGKLPQVVTSGSGTFFNLNTPKQ